MLRSAAIRDMGGRLRSYEQSFRTTMMSWGFKGMPLFYIRDSRIANTIVVALKIRDLRSDRPAVPAQLEMEKAFVR